MERKPRKKKKKYTLMILPHSSSTPRSINIPMWCIYGLAMFGIASFLVASYLVYSYFTLQETIVENKELKIVNNIQAKEIKQLEETTEQALSKLEEISKTNFEVRKLVGLEKEEKKSASRSQGGLGTQGRKIQTFALSDIDLMNSLDDEENSEIKFSSTYNLNKNNNLHTIEKIKYDLDKVNQLLAEQENVLTKLEVDVKNRLDYLSSLPSGWPVRGRITSDFGWRRSPFNRSRWEFHDGLDIAASYGTPVRAAGDGVVIYSGWKPVFGRTVVIKHGYGYSSQYGHNSRINVKAGERVKRGDIIARIGSTGRSTGPHVDFRIIFNGRWIDPQKILK